MHGVRVLREAIVAMTLPLVCNKILRISHPTVLVDRIIHCSLLLQSSLKLQDDINNRSMKKLSEYIDQYEELVKKMKSKRPSPLRWY